jgi:hypothetical protein
MSDYFLNKIYDSILKNTATKSSEFKTLTEAYNLIEQEQAQQVRQNKPVKPRGPITSTPDYINNILTQAVQSGQLSQVEPQGNYQNALSSKAFNVDARDIAAYNILYTEAPPTQKGIPQSKGSGKGELALFWLLSKTHDVADTRGEGQPDLTVNGQGVEVKAYESNEMGLGRFGEQYDNRNLLSIVFGLKAILNLSNTATGGVRPPSLDTFNKEELVDAFQAVINLDNIKELRAISSMYAPIAALYKQLDFLLNKLQLQSGKFEAKEGAAKLLTTILKTKLKDKPGFPGYIANCFRKGDIKIYPVTEEKLDSLSSDIILANVKADGAAIKIKPAALFW